MQYKTSINRYTRHTRHNLATSLHFRLDLLQQLLQLSLIRLLRRPLNAQTLLLIWLGDQVEMHMIDLLMRDTTVVLQNIVVFDALRNGDLLGHGQHFGQLVVGNVMELRAVVFGDDQLEEQLLAHVVSTVRNC